MQSFSKQTLKIFWQHAWKYKYKVILLVIGVFAVEIVVTYIPVLYRDLFNLLAGNHTQNIFDAGLKIVWLILLLNVIKILVWRSHNFLNNAFQPKVMADLTNTCYQYLQKHSVGFFAGNFVGSLVTKVKRYERSFEAIADQIYYDLGRSILDTAFILVVLFWQYPSYALVIMLWFFAYLTFSYFFSLYKLPWDIKRADADTRTTGQLADSITNNTNIKLFSAYAAENKRFFEVTQKQYFLRKKSWDLGTIGEVVQSLAMIFLEFGVMFFAVKSWFNGALQVGDLVLLQAYIFRISDKLWNTGKNIRTIYEALADANEMTQMLGTPYEVQDLTNKKLKVNSAKITFANVDFVYKNGNKIFQNFSMEIAPKEKVAIIGPSGGGKTTLTKLLLRFLDVNKGKILIDSTDISKVTQDSLREVIAFVPQEPILFHRSLLENIRYAKPDASDEEVFSAAKLAHAHEFINQFPEGYSAMVGERGIKLSGGQRQRVAIARAILKNAPILVLDEATSSLDSESEQLIQDALKVLMKDKTVIVIAHRLSTIMQMDRIIVLENGKITEQGMHEELLKAKQGTYQRLWNIQAGGFTN